MKISIGTEILEFPDEILLDQLADLDFGSLEQLKKLGQKPTLEQMQPLFRWLPKFFKTLGIQHKFTVKEFLHIVKSKQLENWIVAITSNFQ